MTSAAPAQVSPLLVPLTVRGVTLPNRVVMGSMHLGLEDRHEDLPKLAAFYAERARGGVGLIVTGGVGPNAEGAVSRHGGLLATPEDARAHRCITDAVHAEGGRILVQLLHAGRYAPGADLVSASATRAPISRHTARELSVGEIEATVAAFARSAELALEAGYDGVEVMASEGYLLNQFLAPATNLRTDEYGGSAEGRRRFPVAVVAAVRAALGERGLLSVRTSLTDLVPEGQDLEEVRATARAFEAAGADLLMTGIGWHEARVPTVVTSVPRGAFTSATAAVRDAVSIPLIAANRLTTPADAEAVLAAGHADLVALARPLLADPAWVRTIGSDDPADLTPCIACNQACLDHVFLGRTVSCLMNPRAGRETESEYAVPVPVEIGRRRRVAVVGAGPAGLTAAHRAARFGHEVTLFDASDEPGGQFRLARRIPGKEEFGPALDHLAARATAAGVEMRLGESVTAATLTDGSGTPAFDEVVVATGVRPRRIELEGAGTPDAPAVHSYEDVLAGRVEVGPRVAVIGAGGVGVDVAEYLSSGGERHDGAPEDVDHWRARWGVTDAPDVRGGLTRPARSEAVREVTLLQRSPGAVGARLRPTTGWVHRAELKRHGVRGVSGAEYVGVDARGLHITVPAPDAAAGEAGAGERGAGGDGGDGGVPVEAGGRVAQVLDVTDVVVCAGQEPVSELAEEVVAAGYPAEAVRLVGGAADARAIDAYRAMDHAVRTVQG